MHSRSVALGTQPHSVIASKLHQLRDEEAAQAYELAARNEAANEEAFFVPPRQWLFTEYEYGFIKRPDTQTNMEILQYQDIIPARSMQSDPNLQNQQIDVYLDWLYAYEYPLSWGELLGIDQNNVHTILFSFEAHNQLVHSHEHVAFNQTYKVKSGQSSAITGHPIFLNINVGTRGINFSCKTMNVNNSSDKILMDIFSSDMMKQGLKLLNVTQPALLPFVGMATDLFKSLIRNNNIVVHDFMLGLDFETGATGARLAEGTYVIVQVPHPNTLTWNDWKYDTEHGTIVKTNLVDGEQLHVIRHNTLLFRVSKSKSKK